MKRQTRINAIVATAIVIFTATYLSPPSLANTATDAISKNLILQNSLPADGNDRDLACLTQLYADRGMDPLWISDSGITRRGLDVVNVLRNASYDGLIPDDYGLSAIDALLESTRSDDLAELDLRLSLGLMQLVSDLGSGRTKPAEVDPELFVYPQNISKHDAIREAVKATDIGVFVAGYRPRHVDYWRLKGKLADYRAIARAGGWGNIEPGPLLEVGMTDPRVDQLRARLRRTHDLTASPSVALSGGDPYVFDQDLGAAVMHFQARHGLEADGKVGRNTLAALNVPVEARIKQIVLNLERRRWVPDEVDERYIAVNLADFSLQLMDHGETVLEMPVVIGSRYNRTPVFSADMTYLVINPYWNVPPSIAKNEILPKIKVDPGYLQSQNFELFSDWTEKGDLLDPMTIDWQDVMPDRFSYKLRQRPGPTNALGRLKFMLPNEFNIYLHDTPERDDFAQSQRSFSHGCIRVAEPELLAAMLLKDQPAWRLDEIQSAIVSGERNVVTLDTSVPVNITYRTAWVDDDNTVHFRNDVYERDAALAASLIGQEMIAGTISAELDMSDGISIAQ